MDIKEISDRLFCSYRIRGDILDKDKRVLTSFLNELNDFGSETDRFKISMCAPVRRLQQKTQVFPLDVKATSRNRLSHSLEVQEYTRLISYSLVSALKDRGTDISSLMPAMLCILSNASLMHDIGNPPFGHFGESLIRCWIKSAVERRQVSSEMSLLEKDDLLNFNGNAQGLRLLHSVQDLNLTLGQYASVIKVPYTLKELLLGKGKGNAGNGIHKDYYSWAYSNAGVFLSEKDLLDALREHCKRDTRHPFATIIEYADDLSYVLADLEDAYDRGLFDHHTIVNLCASLSDFSSLCSSSELSDICQALDPEYIKKSFKKSKAQALFYVRDVVSHFVISDLVRAICSDFELFVMTGEPDFSKDEYPGIMILEMLKDFENRTVYDHQDVQTLDLSGARYLNSIFSMYERLLFQSSEALASEFSKEGGDPYCKRLASRISTRHQLAYFKSLNSGKFSEMYLRLRLIIDYISGMTDTYAEAEYRLLNGIH